MAREPDALRFEPRGRLVFTDQRPLGRECIAVLDLDTLRVAVIDPIELRLYSLCDGARTSADIARLVSALSEEEIEAGLTRLERLGILRRARRPSVDPMESLARAELEWPRRTTSDRGATVTSGTPFISDRAWRERTPVPEGEDATEAEGSPARSSSELRRLVDDAVEAVLGFPDRPSS